MPYYARIDNSTVEGRRTAARLLALRRQLDEDIPPRGVSGNLLIATWNIREFESPAYGRREDEPLYYIAEVIARFDLVAVQEVREDLSSLHRVLTILGGWWKLLVTDVTEGKAGNHERTAFLYDSRKVTFGGLASDLVMPPARKGEGARQPARSPFLCGFKAGWFQFSICTVHTVFGKGGADSPERVAEIASVAGLLSRRAQRATADRWSKNVILLGDFNIFSTRDKTFAALKSAGFEVPENMVGLQTNAKRDKAYDQIAFKTSVGGFMLTGRSGVFDFYKSVYRPEDAAVYARAMGPKYQDAKDPKAALKYFRTYWRTYQMSDHLPLWAELNTDFSNFYLEQKARKPVLALDGARA